MCPNVKCGWENKGVYKVLIGGVNSAQTTFTSSHLPLFVIHTLFIAIIIQSKFTSSFASTTFLLHPLLLPSFLFLIIFDTSTLFAIIGSSSSAGLLLLFFVLHAFLHRLFFLRTNFICHRSSFCFYFSTLILAVAQFLSCPSAFPLSFCIFPSAAAKFSL